MCKWIEELQKKIQEKLSEKGQGMTEYAIILAVVAVVAVAVFMGNNGQGGALGTAINGAYDQASNAVSNIKVQ